MEVVNIVALITHIVILLYKRDDVGGIVGQLSRHGSRDELLQLCVGRELVLGDSKDDIGILFLDVSGNLTDGWVVLYRIESVDHMGYFKRTYFRD